MAKSYYAILGIPSNATADEVKSAYRRLAKNFHPDLFSGGNETFREIQEAYSVLGDPRRRCQYENSRNRVAVRTPDRQASPSGPEPLIPEDRGMDIGEISPVRSFERFTPSLNEIFDWLWQNFSSLDAPKSGRVQNLAMEVPLTTEQVRLGGNAKVMVPARAICSTCRGFGEIGVYPCSRCDGEGVIVGEVPVLIAFPPGLTGDHAVMIPLDRFGIRNLHLTVLFRPTDT